MNGEISELKKMLDSQREKYNELQKKFDNL